MSALCNDLRDLQQYKRSPSEEQTQRRVPSFSPKEPSAFEGLREPESWQNSSGRMSKWLQYFSSNR